VQAGLHERYAAVTSRRGFAPADVEAGRAYVGAYVEYVHHVERLYAAAAPTDDTPAAHGTAHAHDRAPAHAH
jgi:hypothetical protein